MDRYCFKLQYYSALFLETREKAIKNNCKHSFNNFNIFISYLTTFNLSNSFNLIVLLNFSENSIKLTLYIHVSKTQQRPRIWTRSYLPSPPPPRLTITASIGNIGFKEATDDTADNTEEFQPTRHTGYKLQLRKILWKLLTLLVSFKSQSTNDTYECYSWSEEASHHRCDQMITKKKITDFFKTIFSVILKYF